MHHVASLNLSDILKALKTTIFILINQFESNDGTKSNDWRTLEKEKLQN